MAKDIRTPSAKLAAEEIGAIQRVWGRFAKHVPFAAQSSGVYELAADQIETAAVHDVPDGTYRVIGADWALTFVDGRFMQATKAGTMKADEYREIPQASSIG